MPHVTFSDYVPPALKIKRTGRYPYVSQKTTESWAIINTYSDFIYLEEQFLHFLYEMINYISYFVIYFVLSMRDYITNSSKNMYL